MRHPPAGSSADASNLSGVPLGSSGVAGISACSAATIATVSSTSKVIDISAANAGADVATYATAAVPPLVQGRTYSYVRFRMSAAFTLKGSGTDNFGSFCNTTSSNNNTSTSTAKGAAQASSAAAAAAAATAQVMTVPKVGIFAKPTAADLASQGMTQDGDDLVVVQAVPAFTVGGKAPTVVVKFDTQNTILFIAVGAVPPGAACALVFPQPPAVAISFR